MDGFSITGVDALVAQMQKKVLLADRAAVRIVQRSQAVVEANAKAQFTGAHKKGEPTTSPPGSPPDVVSGTLRRSIKSERATRDGAFSARGRVYPTVVYARIQELGGVAGRGSVLPARPYMAPAEAMSKAAMGRIALEEWAKI